MKVNKFYNKWCMSTSCGWFREEAIPLLFFSTISPLSSALPTHL